MHTVWHGVALLSACSRQYVDWRSTAGQMSWLFRIRISIC